MSVSHPVTTAAAHFFLFTSQAALTGLLPVVLVVLSPAFASTAVDLGRVRRELAGRLGQVLDGCVVVAALSTLLLLGLQVQLLAGVAGAGSEAGPVVTALDTHVGQCAVLRLGLLAALALVLHGRVGPGLLDSGPARPPALWWWSWGVLGTGVLLTVSLSGHAATVGAGPLVLLADVVHLAAGAGWLSGVAVLALVLPGSLRGLRPFDQHAVLSRAVTAFSQLALVAVPLVAITGTISVLADLGRLADLRVTGYGHALAIKLWLFGWVLAFGGYNHYRLRLRLAGRSGPVAATRARQSLALTVTGELVFGLLVVAATALLVGLPKTG